MLINYCPFLRQANILYAHENKYLDIVNKVCHSSKYLYTRKESMIILPLMKLCFKMDGFGFKSLAADFDSYFC
jgi:hypothetical protein